MAPSSRGRRRRSQQQQQQQRSRRTKNKRGCGILNTLINKLPVELHLPGYQYCGPGTKLSERLNRGDPGINELDKSCKLHDIAYSRSTNLNDRHAADERLRDAAKQIAKGKTSSGLGERTSAWLVGKAMDAKLKFGMGLNSNSNNNNNNNNNNNTKTKKKKKKMKKKKKKNKKMAAKR